MTNPPFSCVAHSFSKALGEREITNEDLSKMMDTSDEWIKKRTGIETRYWGEDGTTASTLAVKAAKDCFAKANCTEVDAIVAATLSPDFCFPGIGVQVQTGLGLGHVPAYDLRNRCHLNGLAMRDGHPRYVPALGETDTPGGWRSWR